MKTLRRLSVPTGDILVVEGDHGKLECLSLGDYGQAVNLNQHKSVPDGLPLLPLTEKWVVTISTQYGCSMGCRFCDVPKVGPGRNATDDDLYGQVVTCLELHPEIKSTKRLNIHYARMGEPSWNAHNVVMATYYLKMAFPSMNIHPVVSTMMPRKNPALRSFLRDWMEVKNGTFRGNAGLQLSINSTDENERLAMFSGSALELWEISEIINKAAPIVDGRKITLNFAVADYTVDAPLLAKLFPPDRFICKLTPMHKTAAALRNGIETEGDYTTPEPYVELEKRLKDVGFDVLVFIASHDEDAGRITCGNAILSGSMPHKFVDVAQHGS